jgi:hypothetical protein
MTSIGSSTSFWQQDQQFWSQGQAQTQALAANTSLINVMANAQANLTAGLASIANQEALNRVNSQISTIVQQTLNSATGTSGTASSTGSSTSSSSSSSATTTSAKPTPSPASLTGKAIVTPGTSLSSLGILNGGTITVSAGTNATTYTSTGTDTIGDLINAINVDLSTNAQVTASLSSSGHLVITSRNNKDSIAVVGSGTDAAAIGFSAKNSSAQPTTPSSTTAGTTTGSTTNSSSTGTSSSTTSSANLAAEYSNSLAQQNLTSAQGIFTGTGVNGTLLNMLT